MTQIIQTVDTEEKVAERSGDAAEWTFVNQEFQQFFETLLIEGADVLGGTPVTKGDPNSDDYVIGDQFVTLLPGDDGFEDAFWQAIFEDHELVVVSDVQYLPDDDKFPKLFWEEILSDGYTHARKR